jgi:hypothetical protein
MEAAPRVGNGADPRIDGRAGEFAISGGRGLA